MNIWPRLGISVVLSAGFYILMTSGVQKMRLFEAHKGMWTLGLLGGGLLLVLLGTTAKRRAADAAAASDSAEAGAGAATGGFLSLRYCGAMLMVFGVITLVITPSQRKTLVAAARSVTVRKEAPTDRRAALAARLQGVIFRPSNPSAIFDGSPVFIGDKIGQATVVAITRRTVTLNYGGSEQVLRVPDAVDRAPTDRSEGRRWGSRR
jgi:hypothetical protein